MSADLSFTSPLQGKIDRFASSLRREPLHMREETIERIRTVLAQHGRLSRDVTQLGEDDDLYQAGMTSHASMNVMLALEGEFELEFPDALLRRSVFGGIGSIAAAIEEVRRGQ